MTARGLCNRVHDLLVEVMGPDAHAILYPRPLDEIRAERAGQLLALGGEIA
jgi:hypothetical protein